MGGRGASQGRALGRSLARLAGRSATGFGGQGGREAQVAPVGNVCPHHGQHAHVGSAWHLPHAAQNLTCGAPCGGGRAAAAAVAAVAAAAALFALLAAGGRAACNVVAAGGHGPNGSPPPVSLRR